jgi:hypothetical protein
MRDVGGQDAIADTNQRASIACKFIPVSSNIHLGSQHPMMLFYDINSFESSGIVDAQPMAVVKGERVEDWSESLT